MSNLPTQIQFSSSSVFQLRVTPQANKGKVVTTRGIEVLDNVTVITLDENDAMGYIQSGHLNSNSYNSGTYTKPGIFRVFACLKFLQESAPPPNANPATFTYLAGVGDGDPNDFVGSANAVRFTVTFQSATAPASPNSGNTVTIASWPFNLNGLVNYSLKQSDLQASVGSWPASCKIEILQAANSRGPGNVPAIETNVELQILDAQGNLKAILDAKRTSVELPIATDFHLFALIDPPPGKSPNGNLGFAIGDPKTDATVNLRERDV